MHIEANSIGTRQINKYQSSVLYSSHFSENALICMFYKHSKGLQVNIKTIKLMTTGMATSFGIDNETTEVVGTFCLLILIKRTNS